MNEELGQERSRLRKRRDRPFWGGAQRPRWCQQAKEARSSPLPPSSVEAASLPPAL